jgi:hypothetical protein
MVEAVRQNLIRVQSKEPVPREAIYNGSIEKDGIRRS